MQFFMIAAIIEPHGRLARQTLCFSRSTAMHDAVIGLFINQYEFARGI
jgi:insertion element IS1 protein InsB